MKYFELVEASLEPVREYLSGDNFCEVVGNDVKRVQPYRAASREAGIRMRLDYELSPAEIDNFENLEKRDHVAHLIITQLAGDLADVLEHGDMHSDDYLLKAFDGSIKRKQEPAQIDFDYVQAYQEKKPRKGTYEITIFLTVHIDWSK